MKNIIFIAPPAAGKGTQSKLVSEQYNIPHISTGDLLREETSNKSDLGIKIQEEMNKGNLIDDSIITTLLKKRLSKNDCNNGYILDGYPRNVSQAITYENMLKELNTSLGVVIFLDIDKEVALKRTLNRIVCPHCGSSYNLLTVKPHKEGICDRCNHELKVRNDDNEETFINRFDTYKNKTQDLIDFYREKGVLEVIKINNTSTPESTFNHVKEIINK